MIVLQNEHLIVKVKEKGAELSGLVAKKSNCEYLWQAGPAWPKSAPVLFPIVGQLKENRYFFEGQEYFMERHGFARNTNFDILHKETDSAIFALNSNSETLKMFPFHFCLTNTYKLTQSQLAVSYSVENTGNEKMFFSIGAHPAFKIPVHDSEKYEDYFLEFEKKETVEKNDLVNGLIAHKQQPFLNNKNRIRLSKELFYNDAIVLKQLKSESILIKSVKSGYGIKFSFRGFPYFGIWAAKDADFICLEPWHGVADHVEHNQQIESKEGINSLLPGEKFNCQYEVEVF